MARKTFHEKLHDSKDMPKIIDLSNKPEVVAKYSGNKMLIAEPLQYHKVMAKVPEGEIITSERIRKYLAEDAGADFTCPLTAGLFINLCAKASDENEDDSIPYWRTLRARGELNEKYPEGIEGQIEKLEQEGHEIIKRGKRYFVKDFEDKLWDIK